MDKEKESRLKELEAGYSKYGMELFIRYYGYKTFKELKILRIMKKMEIKHE